MFSNTIKRLCLALLLSSSAQVISTQALANNDEGFKPVNLDELIQTSKPTYQGTVEILQFRKIKWQAEMAVMPDTMKTDYLMETLSMMGVKPLPKVTQGMLVQSESGKIQRVYVEDTVAEDMRAMLKVGQKVLLYGYHAFNSKHGPGILVSGYDL